MNIKFPAVNSLQKLVIFLLFLMVNVGFSQSSCPNSDFESGTLTGWQGAVGVCCPINATTAGIVTGRHTIMSGTGTDPNTCDVVTVVAPGGLYSARLGNDGSGAQAEKLSYSITVSAANALFIYKYAVVLEDPGHLPSEQPRFQIRVLDATGTLIDPICGEYTVVSGDNIPGFQTCFGSIRYKDWTTVGLDLTSYIGQTITIEFATGDCDLGGHYGYAYVDAYCSPLQISSTYCTGSFAAVLTAPIGFTYLWNTGATTQSINVNNPNAGLTYTCLLTSVTGCTVNISTNLTLFDPIANFTITNTCYDAAIFQNTTALPFGTILDTFSWNFGDGTTANIENPTHIFSAPGTYNVTFTISNALGCTSTTTYPVTVYQSPTASINYTGGNFCTYVTTPQTVNLTGTNLYLGGTFISTAGLTLDATTGAITPSTSIPGNYVVSYTIPTANGCSVPPSTVNVTITLAPTATILYPNSPYCGNLTAPQSVLLNGTSSYTGGAFTSTPGLTIDSVTGAITPSTSSSGTYIVTYTVPAVGGCTSFPVTTSVTIISYPTAAFTYAGTPFCTSLNALQPASISGTFTFSGGVYSAPTGLSLNSVTGEINPSLSLPGTYIVTYTIPSIPNCTLSPVTTSVTITNLPSAALSYGTPFCRDVTTPQPVNLSGTFAYTNGVYTATPTGLVINSTTGAITPSASNAGTYVITYTIPATAGCAAIPVTTTVVINPLPEPTLVDGDICFNANGVLVRPYSFVSGLTIFSYSFEWFFNGALIAGANQSYYTANAVGNYSVVATNLLTGCKNSPVVGSVIAAQMATDFYTSIDDTFTDNNVMTVIVQGGTGPFYYQLDNGPLQTSNVFYQVPSGVHTVTITDDTNCTVLTKPVTVMGYPKFFTPNGDGPNEYWNIYYYNNLPEAQVFIFDRTGKFLKQIDPRGNGWDGLYNGSQVPATDYWFLVKYKENNLNGVREEREFRAHFALKR
jgi:gliding motility-associated-like protein